MTTTSASGSTTQAARVPTAARAIVTLIEPGTCSPSNSRGERPSIERGARVHEFSHARGRVRLDLRRLREERPSVQLDHALEVRRLRGQVTRQLADEIAFVGQFRQAVVAALEPDRRAGLLAHPGTAAQGAADVAGPDLGEVVQRKQPAQRAEKRMRALLRLHRQIGTSEVADEERVAGDREPGFVAAAGVRDQEGHVLRAMARRGERRDPHVPEGDDVAVGERVVGVLDSRFGRHVDRGAGRLDQPSMAGDMVGVVVGLEDVANREAVLLGQLEVVGDVPLRIDHRRLSVRRHDIGGAAEIVVEHLAEEHSAMVSGRRPSEDFGSTSRFGIFLGSA